MSIDHPKTGDIPGMRRLWQEAFGDPEAFLDLFFRTAYDSHRCLRHLEGDTVTAALYWFDCQWEDRRIAYVYAVATARSHRGRGLCRSLLEQLHEELARRGYAGAILVPGEPELFRFYEKLGYVTCATVRQCRCTCSETAVDLKPVEPAAYAELRRKLLPRNGLVQEGENLRLLEALGQFYAGEALAVWAAASENGQITGELLGDPALAPGVVKALGGRTGNFRMPGTEKVFAMYRSLDGSAGPGYLGFAYD